MPGGGRGRGPLVTLVFSSVAFLLGALLALQARVNGQLGLALGNQVQAALISFTVGLIALCLLYAVVPTMRAVYVERGMVALGTRQVPLLISPARITCAEDVRGVQDRNR